MSIVFIWLESSSTNFVSERDPDEIVQTHMLSWAFADHICHKWHRYQAHMGLRASWFHARVRAVFKKKIRMIEVPSVSHAAWTYCRTGKSFKILKREGRVGGVSRITWESRIFKP